MNFFFSSGTAFLDEQILRTDQKRASGHRSDGLSSQKSVKTDMRDLSKLTWEICQVIFGNFRCFCHILLHCHSNIHRRLRLVILLLFISCLTYLQRCCGPCPMIWSFFFWWDGLKLDACQIWQMDLSKYKHWQWQIDTIPIIPILEIMEPVIK